MCLKRKIRNNYIDNLKDFRDNLTDAKCKKVIDDVIDLEEHETAINLKLEKFINKFEDDIGAKVKTEDTALLASLYNDFVEEVYEPSVLDKKAIVTKNKLKEQLEEGLTDNQKVLLRSISYCYTRMREHIALESFIYGYGMASQMKTESISKYPRNHKVHNK